MAPEGRGTRANREGLAQFEDRIKLRMYVSALRVVLYVSTKKLHFAGTGVRKRKINSVACGFSPIEIHFLTAR